MAEEIFFLILLFSLQRVLSVLKMQWKILISERAIEYSEYWGNNLHAGGFKAHCMI